MTSLKQTSTRTCRTLLSIIKLSLLLLILLLLLCGSTTTTTIKASANVDDALVKSTRTGSLGNDDNHDIVAVAVVDTVHYNNNGEEEDDEYRSAHPVVTTTAVTTTSHQGLLRSNSIISRVTSTTSSSSSNNNNNNRRQIQTTSIGPQIEDLILINTDTDLPITTLSDNMIINIPSIGTNQFNILATTTGTTVGSIKFQYNTTTTKYAVVENAAPYVLCGNDGPTNCLPCSRISILQTIGTYTITATSYSEKRATGSIVSQKTVTFQITNTTVTPISAASCTIPRFTSGWESMLPSYPMIVNEVQADLIGDDIVIAGGFINSFSNVTKRTYARSIVNMETTIWRRMDDMPVPIGITHAATVVVGMKMYMCGGYVGPPPGPHTSICLLYDHSIPPGNGLQWKRFRTLPRNGTAGGGMIYDSNTNTIYYTGGAQRPTLGSLVAIDITRTWKISLDNVQGGWIRSTNIPYGANHQSYVTVNYLQDIERHYIFGGQIDENERNGNVDLVYEFNPNTEVWRKRTNLPYPRGHTTVSSRAIGHCGYITAGGSINSNLGEVRLNRTAEIHYYHIPTNTWHFIGSLPQPGATPPVFIGPDNYMYFVARTTVYRRKFAL